MASTMASADHEGVPVRIGHATLGLCAAARLHGAVPANDLLRHLHNGVAPEGSHIAMPPVAQDAARQWARAITRHLNFPPFCDTPIAAMRLRSSNTFTFQSCVAGPMKVLAHWPKRLKWFFVHWLNRLLGNSMCHWPQKSR